MGQALEGGALMPDHRPKARFQRLPRHLPGVTVKKSSENWRFPAGFGATRPFWFPPALATNVSRVIVTTIDCRQSGSAFDINIKS